MTRLDKWYGRMLMGIMKKGVREVNKRTGHETAAFAGTTFRTDLEEDGFPVLTLRKINVIAPIAEQVWFLGGEKSPVPFLRQYTRIWDAFTEENGEVAAAYGHRWKRHFGIDQIQTIVEMLRDDPSNRHGVVMTWDPRDMVSDYKNVPCPYTFTVNIIGGRLNLHNMVRSNDMILGFPFDVFGFALLQHMLAQRLGVRVGVYTHSISHAHVYDVHYEAAAELIARSKANPGGETDKVEILMPENSLLRGMLLEHSLVDDLVAEFDQKYRPLEAIKGLGIVK